MLSEEASTLSLWGLTVDASSLSMTPFLVFPRELNDPMIIRARVAFCQPAPLESGRAALTP